jgi:hypothetical protein
MTVETIAVDEVQLDDLLMVTEGLAKLKRVDGIRTTWLLVKGHAKLPNEFEVTILDSLGYSPIRNNAASFKFNEFQNIVVLEGKHRKRYLDHIKTREVVAPKLVTEREKLGLVNIQKAEPKPKGIRIPTFKKVRR